MKKTEETNEEVVKETEEKKKNEPALTRDEAIKAMRVEKRKKAEEEALSGWVPKTKLGRLVKTGEIKEINDILDRYKILEPEVVDTLIKVKDDLLSIGQHKGKFGGGKRRAWKQTQKKTAEGNVATFSAMAVVGDGNGHVGVGHGRAKENLPAREKAIRKAKLGIIRVTRGCGSFDCSCKEPHSVPVKVEGKCGSSRVILIPAPQGTGLAVADEIKKILKLAGIKDAYSKTFGQTRTTLNLAKATMEALNKTNKIKRI